jgi:DNA-binding transcriptional ArsR family regulator
MPVMSDPRVKHITDLAGLRALGHPLRLRLLGLLRMHGPATATALGQTVGAAPNAVSYHLRQLARAGFIEPAAVSGSDRREHAWQASHDVTSWEDTNFGDSVESHVALDALRRRVFDVYNEAIERYLRSEVDLPEPWRQAAGFGDLVFRATPADLRAVRDEVEAVVERHRQRAADLADEAGTEMVMVIWHAFPRPAGR